MKRIHTNWIVTDRGLVGFDKSYAEGTATPRARLRRRTRNVWTMELPKNRNTRAINLKK